MAVRLTPIGSLTGRQVAQWRELAARAVEPNPFHEADFVLAARRHVGGRHVALLTIERKGAVVAAMAVRRRGLGPLSSLVDWRHPYTFLSTPLVDADALSHVADELAAVARRRRPALLSFDRLGADGPVGAAMAEAMEQYGYSVVRRRDADRAALTRESVRDGFAPSKRTQHELRRQRRRLSEALDGEAEIVDRSGSDAAVEDFLALERASWKGREGTAIESAGHGDFFREVCRSFAAAGRLQLLSLGTTDHAAAMSCELSAGDTLFGFKLAYDEDLRRAGPGMQLVHGLAEIFARDRDERLLDSCSAPGNALMNRAWPDRRAISTLVAAKTGLSSAISRSSLRTADGLRSSAHRIIDARS